jgi:hypothetical protein
VKDSRHLDGCANSPPQHLPCTHFVTGAPGTGAGESPCPKLPPIETLVPPPFREEEPRHEDQGAFHRQRSARYVSITRCALRRIGLPSRRSYGRSIANRPATVPGGSDEPRLLMPWLGRTSAFVSDPVRLTLTSEAGRVAR